jgi:hypothetical protein
MSVMYEAVCDALAAADCFELKTITADDDKVTYRVAFRMTLDRNSYSVLTGIASEQGRTVVGTLRRKIRESFKFCFGVER